MIDKPEEGKKLKPKKAMPKKEETPTVEEAKPTIIEEAIAPKIVAPQQSAPKTDKPSSTEEVAEAKIESLEEAAQPKTLDEQLLDFYKTAAPGNLSLGQIMVQLGVDDPTLIKQAWDRLYDQHKVPFSKLFKPPLGYVSFEP